MYVEEVCIFLFVGNSGFICILLMKVVVGLVMDDCVFVWVICCVGGVIVLVNGVVMFNVVFSSVFCVVDL